MSNDSPPIDHVMHEESERRPVEDNLKSRDTWLRLVFMVIYGALLSVTSIVVTAIIVLGFLVVLFTGERNNQLVEAGQAATEYIRQVLRYLTYNSDEKPFPFGERFPGGDAD